MTIGETYDVIDLGDRHYVCNYSNSLNKNRIVRSKTWRGGDGRNRVNSYNMDFWSVRQDFQSGYRKLSDGTCGTQLNYIRFFNFPDHSPVDKGAADLLALTALIDSCTKDFNPYVSLGEARDTMKFVADNMFNFGRSLRFARKGDWKRAFESVGVHRGTYRSKNVSQRWLEYRYAIVPVIQDINNALDYFNSDDNHHGGQKVKGRRRVYPDVEWSGTYMGQPQYWPNKKVWVSTEYGCTLPARPEGYDNFKWGNPYALAWELTPFSFVVDWVVPIGDWLNSLYFLWSSGWLADGYKTQFYCRHSGKPKFYDISCTHSDCGGHTPAVAYNKQINVNRKQWVGIFPPSPKFRNPLTKDYHYKRLFDAVAFVGMQGYKGKRRFQ